MRWCCDDKPSLSSDAPDDKMRTPYLGVHVRRSFFLFGHVTSHEPIRDALDNHPSQFHVDLVSDLAKTKCGECPLYYYGLYIIIHNADFTM